VPFGEGEVGELGSLGVGPEVLQQGTVAAELVCDGERALESGVRHPVEAAGGDGLPGVHHSADQGGIGGDLISLAMALASVVGYEGGRPGRHVGAPLVRQAFQRPRGPIARDHSQHQRARERHPGGPERDALQEVLECGGH
jgi:hypothetical protein